MDLIKLAGRKPDIMDSERYFKSAVTVPVVNIDGVDQILFEVRSDTIKRQPGEISFPGGGMEKTDSCSMETAIRETTEELGISKEDIQIIAPLDIVITPFNLIIYPYVGRILNPGIIKPNADEVKEVFYVPIDFFVKNKPNTYYVTVKVEPTADFPYHLIPYGNNYRWRTGQYPEHFYQYKDHVIWGLTARILLNFLTLSGI
ncbi:NUDIX hydrolase [Calorimonas adulescens]|uniref:CoA pyrophosphatase n=1 Tax=Calorimonas adulescens TaxID=2606906 RepID=A0A5D8QE83_9THEO|nr:CoA pyrophosphatase [Calorimonas adulescens]TZE82865.1 CoA pyrophosphatase [Calorimonas adulescens]